MKKYQIIYADPPWKYREAWGNEVESDIDLNKVSEKAGKTL